MILQLVALLFFVSSCSNPRLEESHIASYGYLQKIRGMQQKARTVVEEDLPEYALIVHVDAPHLNYRDITRLLISMRQGIFLSREPTIGHAWVTLCGRDENNVFCRYEVGHSGELGLSAPKYFDEVMERARSMTHSNPVSYLYTTLPDGYQELGSLDHTPTLSVLFPITQEAFDSWKKMTFGTNGYDFTRWSLMDHNCVTYVRASLEKCHIEETIETVTIEIPQIFEFDEERLVLWEDSRYRTCTLHTADSLEKWLFDQVVLGRGQFLSSRALQRIHSTHNLKDATLEK